MYDWNTLQNANNPIITATYIPSYLQYALKANLDIVSRVLGVAFLVLAGLLAVRHNKMYLFLLCSPALFLFNGYVDTMYGMWWVATTLMIFSYLEKTWWLGVMAGLLALLSHSVLFLCVSPLFLYILYQWAKGSTGKWIVALIEVNACIWWVQKAYNAGPNYSAAMKFTGPYSMFSLQHIVDVVAVVLFGLAFLIPSLKASDWKKSVKSYVTNPLAWCAFLVLGLTFGVQSHIGMLRDVDLFSCSWLVILALAAGMVTKISKWSYYIAIGTTVLWLALNSWPGSMVMNRDDIMLSYMKSQPQYVAGIGFANGSPIIQASLIYRNELKDTVRFKKLLDAHSFDEAQLKLKVILTQRQLNKITTQFNP